MPIQQHLSALPQRHQHKDQTSGTGLHTCFTCIHFTACHFGNVLNPTKNQPSPLSTHESHLKGRDRSLSFAILLLNTLTYTQKTQSFSSTLMENISSCRVAPKVDCGQTELTVQYWGTANQAQIISLEEPCVNRRQPRELFDITFGWISISEKSSSPNFRQMQ